MPWSSVSLETTPVVPGGQTAKRLTVRGATHISACKGRWAASPGPHDDCRWKVLHDGAELALKQAVCARGVDDLPGTPSLWRGWSEARALSGWIWQCGLCLPAPPNQERSSWWRCNGAGRGGDVMPGEVPNGALGFLEDEGKSYG